ncbi:MAG TPA: biosynthetic peptidoglycan transglycosylase, partial [Myxococcaceae bacterium]|nr:biosynthetic peptidoglycan transglycosylase [Myxococcaceae bacterium]
EAELGRTGEAGWRRIYGPFEVEAQLLRAPSGRTLQGHVTLPGEARASFKLDQAKGAPLSVEGRAEAIPFQSLPDVIASRLPAKLVGGTAGGHVKLEAPADLSTATVTGSLALRGLTVSNERLAPEPVGPLDMAVDARASWTRKTRTLALEKGSVVLGKDRATSLELLGELHLVAERPFWISLKAGPVSYPALLASVPPQLAPGPEVPRPEGPLGATARIAGDLDRPEAWNVEVKLELTGLKKAARTTPIPLAGPFAYEPQESVGKPRELWVGDKNPRFVPFAELPLYVSHAVTCSEDISFFTHQGFVFLEMRDAFVEATQHKRLRGASTLTQQLAKNLYLSRERTFSRKAKEAFVTVMLEAALPKQRLMEIYLNIIEWGPDVYGIGEAAPYYFGVDVRELTVKQAVYLATIIPSPLRTHVFFDKGAINEVWEEKIRTVLTRMLDEGSITEAQFHEALAEPLLFRPKDTPLGEGPAAPR